ncbi:c-type cytochrome [Thalassobaculum sp.]|uniref:c-type cytochrome n=1 Tax=Thalassobaculum sp. TaxID=2022740 RepID=UPI0032ED0C33
MRTGLLLLAGFLTAGLCATATAETPVERGRYLVESIAGCGNCHSLQDAGGPIAGKELAGGPLMKEAVFEAYPPNLTPDRETGLGGWSDDEIVRAIREGRSRDGRVMGPPMPFGLYRGIADDDVRAIVAYLRTVKPVINKAPATVYRMPLPESWGPPVAGVQAPARSDPVAYGGYLAGPVGHCVECHTPISAKGELQMTRLGAGTREFAGPWGVSISRNITPATLGDWSDAEIKQAITRGVSRDGTRLMPPMGYGYYAKMTDADLDALIAWMRSLKPVD